MSIAGRFRGFIDRLHFARYRRAAITRQIRDERVEMELDFARNHITRPRPGL